MNEPTQEPDPFTVLEVGADASDQEVRSAYLRKVKQYPPDHCPIEFEQVRNAYEMLRDRRQRVGRRLLAIDPRAPLESLLEGDAGATKFAGPEPWLAVLKRK